jgi:hypothetical protein
MAAPEATDIARSANKASLLTLGNSIGFISDLSNFILMD